MRVLCMGRHRASLALERGAWRVTACAVGAGVESGLERRSVGSEDRSSLGPPQRSMQRRIGLQQPHIYLISEEAQRPEAGGSRTRGVEHGARYP